MINAKKLVLPSAISCIVAGAAMPGYAQQTTEQQAGMLEEVVVTGIRRGLIDALAIKRESSSIVEAISAEDIGKLPDTSIAESLKRLPGVTTQRLNGRANVISIRGLGPEFNSATLNGREQASINDNRAVEFDQYPAELLGAVTVYKTPDASIMAQNLGGTVNMQTIRPLEHGRRDLVVNVRGEFNDKDIDLADTEDTGHRFTLSYIDQFADDTIGVTFGVMDMSSPSQEQRFNAWGYPGAAAPDTGSGGTIVDPDLVGGGFNGFEEGDLILGGTKPFLRSGELERTSILSSVEFEPNDRFHAILDGFFSDFSDDQILRGIEFPAAWGADQMEATKVEDGFVTEGVVRGTRGVMRNDVTVRDADIYAFGGNATYRFTDTWSVNADISYSKAERDDLALESYAGTGRGNGPDGGLKDDIRFSSTDEGFDFDPLRVDYSDPSLIRLTDPQGWGQGGLGGPFQDGFINNIQIEDELTELQFSVNKEMTNPWFSKLEFGVNYKDREKSRDDIGTFLTTVSEAEMEAFANDGTLPESKLIPNEYRNGFTNLDFIGMGRMVSFDSLALFESGFYREIDAGRREASRANGTWTVEEELTTGFVKLDIDTQVARMPLTGNIGFQVVNADQTGSGLAITPRTDDEGLLIVEPISRGDSYTDFLPSLNLKLEVAPDHVVRAAAAKSVSRPNMDDMRGSGTISFDTTRADAGPNAVINSPWSADAGNPALRPTEAVQLDLGYSYFFGESNYASLSVFYKDLDDFVFNGDVVQDFSDFEPPVPTEATLGLASAPTNLDGGFIRGAEFSTSLSGDLLMPALEGWGVILAASYTSSEIEPVDGQDAIAVPGQSREVYDATLFYESNGFEARGSISYRSSFLGEVAGLSLVREERFTTSEATVDAQISYDFSYSKIPMLDGLQIQAQVINLTDEPFETFQNGERRQILDHQSYGRNILFGANYKF